MKERKLTRRQFMGLLVSGAGMTSQAAGLIESTNKTPDQPKRKPGDPYFTKDQFKYTAKVFKGANWRSRILFWGGTAIFASGIGIAGEPGKEKT